MGASAQLVESSLGNVTKAHSLQRDQLEEIAVNVRWLTGLILAEIAGLAYYRELQGLDYLGLHYLLGIGGLALALSLFILAIILARRAARRVGDAVRSAAVEIDDIRSNRTIAESDGDQRISGITTATVGNLPKIGSGAENLESSGLGLFLLATLYCGVLVFLSELATLFDGT